MSETVFTYGAPSLKFGPGASTELAHDVAALGAGRVLLVTDAGVAAAGHPARIAGRLAAAGLEVTTYDGTRVEPTDAAHWKVTGDLTLHGVTKPVVLDTHFLGQGMHPFSKKVSAAFRAEAAVDRSQFGVTWNATLDTGGPYLGERVNISIVILAARQD